MASSIIIPGQHRRQPTGVFRLNLAHPSIANIAFFMVNVNGRFYDLVQNQIGTVNGSAAIAGFSGRAANQAAKLASATSDYYAFADVTPYHITGDISLLWSGTISTGSAYRSFAMKGLAGGGTNTPFDFRTDSSATPQPALVRSNAGAVSFNTTFTTPISLGVAHQVGISTSVAANPGAVCYVDGVSKASTTPGAYTVTADTTNLKVGRRTDGSVQMNGFTEFVIGWARVISADEYAALWDAPYGLVVADPRRLYFGAAAGGSTYAVSVAESGSAVDSPSATLTFSATTAEVGSTADAPLATGTFAATGAEVGAAVDAPSALATFAATTAEAGTAADTPSATFNTAATTAEAGSAIDTDSAAATFAATVAETGSAVDTPSTGSATYSVSTAESGVASDTPSALAVFAATDAESGTAADAPTATAIVGATAAEAGSAVDTSSVGGSIYAVSTAEAGNTIDACSCIIVTTGSIAEGTASAADLASAQAIWAAAIAETGAASDATSALATMAAAAAESGAATDTPSTTAVMGVSVAETGNAVDTQSAAFPYTLTQDISFTATAAGRLFTASARGRSFIATAPGRLFTVQ